MRRPSWNIFDLASDLAEPPNSGSAGAWFFGVLIAVPIVLYGLGCLVIRHAWFFSFDVKGLPTPQGRTFHEWHGGAAMAIGLLYVGVGLFAHFKWFWSSHRCLYRYYEIGELVSSAIIVASVAWWMGETIW